jgi:hypothetical protein
MSFTPARKFKLEALNRDERYLTVPRPARLFLLSLLMYVDQKGREVATSQVLRDTFYEFDEDVTSRDVDGWLNELEARGWLLQYIVGRRVLLQINPAVLAEFVSMDGRDGSRFPAPEPGPEAAQSATWGGLRAESGATAAEGRGGDGETPAWMLDPDMPPPQGCRLHPHNTGLISCGMCGGAVKIHGQFMRGEITHAEAVAAWGGTQGSENS